MNIEINKEVILFEVFDMAQKAAVGTKNAIQKTDLNALRDKTLANGGLLAGAGLAGGGMFYHMMSGDDPEIGASIIGGSVLGTAGAGVGHVIHNQIKKNNQEVNNRNYDNFDYKKY